MGSFILNSANLFLRSVGKSQIMVVNLQRDLNSSSVFERNDWEVVEMVGSNMSYDSLEVFGHVINGEELKRLAMDLCKSRLWVNNEGVCFTRLGITNISYQMVFHQSKELFDWERFGVKRSGMEGLKSDELKEYKEKLEVKDEEIKKLNEKIVEKDEEIGRLKGELLVSCPSDDHREGRKKEFDRGNIDEGRNIENNDWGGRNTRNHDHEERDDWGGRNLSDHHREKLDWGGQNTRYHDQEERDDWSGRNTRDHHQKRLDWGGRKSTTTLKKDNCGIQDKSAKLNNDWNGRK